MSSIASQIGDTGATTPINPATTSKIYNVNLPVAGTEVSQALSTNTKKFMIQSRNNTILRVSTVSGEVNTGPYITIKGQTSRVIDGLDFTGTIYLRSSVPNIVVEIWEWS